MIKEDNRKEDCFAYDKRGKCTCLKELYCKNEKCNFYRNDTNMSKIEMEIEMHYMKK